jgi:glycosyltransferase involved in cell wall biosynthesis
MDEKMVLVPAEAPTPDPIIRLTDFNAHARGAASAEQMSVARDQLSLLPANKLPLLSFVVVNYNYGRYLETCVASIMEQSYSNIECVVVDNASTDYSRDVLDHLARRFPSIKILRSTENLGQNAACSAGLALTKGSYVAFIDADDYLLPSYAGTHIRAHLTVPLSLGFTSGDMVQLVNDTVVVGNYHDAYWIDTKRASTPLANGNIGKVSEALGTSILESPDFFANIRLVSRKNLNWVWAPTSANVYRRDAVLLLAANPRLRNLKFAADAYYNYAINAFAGSAIVEKPLAVYRIHEANSFTKRASMNGSICYVNGTDDTARAAFFALEHMVNEYDAFLAQMGDARVLRKTMRLLKMKARSRNHFVLDHVMKLLTKQFYSYKVWTLRRRFEKQSALERLSYKNDGAADRSQN